MAIIHRDTCLYIVLASTIAGIIIFSSIFVARGQKDSAIDADFVSLNITVGRFRFEPEPKGRGTIGILLSCSLTFLFCIWTAVHPNVLSDSNLWTRTIHKAVAMVIAAINPEGVVISAYGQWRDARLLQQAINNYFEKLDPLPENSTEKVKKEKAREISEWLGMDGAFFVVMGGFILDVSKHKCTENITTPLIKKYSKVYPRKPSRFTATLTPPGFIKYLHEGYFDFQNPQFDRAQIADKGKKSTLAKALSASQAVWLLVHLLEIHMLIQVACTALIIYFWWHKPLDVNEPILLNLVKKGDGDNLALTPIKYIEKGRTEEEIAKILTSMEGVEIANEPLPHPNPADIEKGHKNAAYTALTTE
ncbi:hypothetical protein BZA77DRAFT_358905 [Pyronema omphalodes]|nr:hypothetical protein BZA77DRAFT_358905 [Pyronema omphalodes]